MSEPSWRSIGTRRDQRELDFDREPHVEKANDQLEPQQVLPRGTGVARAVLEQEANRGGAPLGGRAESSTTGPRRRRSSCRRNQSLPRRRGSTDRREDGVHDAQCDPAGARSACPLGRGPAARAHAAEASLRRSSWTMTGPRSPLGSGPELFGPRSRHSSPRGRAAAGPVARREAHQRSGLAAPPIRRRRHTS